MTVTVVTTQTYEHYSSEIDKFAKAVPERAEYSEERAGGHDKSNPEILRCIAYFNSTVVGWMIVKLRKEDLRIEGFCTHTDAELKKGVAKALMNHACEIASKHNRLFTTLYDASQGKGSSFYLHSGFEYIDGPEMRKKMSTAASSSSQNTNGGT